MRKITTHRLLLIIPLALFILSVITTNLQGPFYYGHNFDPEYSYLMDSLNLATLRVPGLYDHPGTTLQAVGALIVLAKWVLGNCLAGSWMSLQEAVLLHPEDYLHTMSIVLNVLLSGTIYLVARRIYALSSSLLAALSFQAGFGMFLETFHAQARVSPEPMLAIAAMILALPVARLVFASTDKPALVDERTPLLLGAALAFGVVTKITFVPLCAGFILLRRRRPVLSGLAAFVTVSLALMFPIWPHYREMSIWFSSLLLHSERYGRGPVGLPSAATLWSHCVTILRAEPMLVPLLALYLLAYVAIRAGWIRTRGLDATPAGRLLLAGSLAIAVQIVITVKHFAIHYLLPAMVFSMLVNAALVFLLQRAEPSPARRVVPVLMVLLLAMGAWHTSRRLLIWRTLSDQYRLNVAAVLQRRSEMKECSIIGYYRSSSQEFALSFGDAMTAGGHANELAAIYPGSVHYNIWAQQLYNMKTESMQQQVRAGLAAGRCYLAQGTPFAAEERNPLPGFVLSQVFAAGDEALYRVLPGQTNRLIAERELSPEAVSIDARNFSAGNVVVDGKTYGAGISAIVSPSYPAYAEFRVQLPQTGRYEFLIRCASQEPRPVTVRFNGVAAEGQGCSEATGGYEPAHQVWQVMGSYEFTRSPVTIRLDRTGPFPVISRLALQPAGRDAR